MKSSSLFNIVHHALAILLIHSKTFVTAEVSGGRSLRGGSYSRGGSSWSGSSGSSSYHRNSNSSWSSNRSNYNRNSGRGMGTAGRVFAGLALAGIGIAVVAMLLPALGIGAACSPCLALLCCGAGAAVGASAANDTRNNYHAYNEDNNGVGSSGSQHNFGAFEAQVQRAKRSVQHRPYQAGHSQPFSGPYYATFVDPESGVTHNAVVSLFFSPDHQKGGYKISGQGSDIDGNTIIEEGHANSDGTAWWRERTITGDVGLHVLSEGRFDFTTSTFNGTWFSSTMLSGPYTNFQAGHTPQPNNVAANVSPSVVVQGTPITGNLGSTSPVVVQGTVVSS